MAYDDDDDDDVKTSDAKSELRFYICIFIIAFSNITIVNLITNLCVCVTVGVTGVFSFSPLRYC